MDRQRLSAIFRWVSFVWGVFLLPLAIPDARYALASWLEGWYMISPILRSEYAGLVFPFISAAVILLSYFWPTLTRTSPKGTEIVTQQISDVDITKTNPPADYDAWSNASELTLIQAACLWCAVEPPLDASVPSGCPRILLNRLKMAVARNQLQPSYNPFTIPSSYLIVRGFIYDPKAITNDLLVRRASLVKYAKVIGERPKFLFKRRWWLLWLGSTAR